MYSCGSLVPKMKRGGGGCMDHQFHKPAQPWEKSEGYTAHKHTHIPTSTHVCVSHFLALQLVCVCLHNYFTLNFFFSYITTGVFFLYQNSVK